MLLRRCVWVTDCYSSCCVWVEKLLFLSKALWHSLVTLPEGYFLYESVRGIFVFRCSGDTLLRFPSSRKEFCFVPRARCRRRAECRVTACVGVSLLRQQVSVASQVSVSRGASFSLLTPLSSLFYPFIFFYGSSVLLFFLIHCAISDLSFPDRSCSSHSLLHPVL